MSGILPIKNEYRDAIEIDIFESLPIIESTNFHD